MGSLGSRPSPFRARFHYVHAANIRSLCACGKHSLANVCRMHIMKTRTERGRPGTETSSECLPHAHNENAHGTGKAWNRG